MWAKNSLNSMMLKIYDLKKRIGIEWLDGSLVEKEHEQVNI